MGLKTLWQRWRSRPAASRRGRPTAPRLRLRLRVNQLEDRTVPTAFTAATVAHLIADINAANTAGGSNIIRLVAGKTLTLTAVDNTTDGATGLPVIAANDTLTIVGNGDTIQRSTASGTPAFRLFDVASGGSLTLKDMTVQDGLAQGDGSRTAWPQARGRYRRKLDRHAIAPSGAPTLLPLRPRCRASRSR